MPENTIYVGRPTVYGNRWSTHAGRAIAVEMYRRDAVEGRIGPITNIKTVEVIRRELGGKNLACWCPLNQQCHADVLLELANGKGS
jgi:hypothetical protein